LPSEYSIDATGWQDDPVARRHLQLPMGPPAPATCGRGPVRAALITLVLMTAGLLLSGCVRAHATFDVSTSDTVSGDLVVGARPSAQAGQASSLAIPAALAGRVTSRTYSADGYTGTELSFSNLNFAELSTLAAAASGATGHYQIAFSRSGDLVSVNGSVDLSEAPQSGLDVQIKVRFPGNVLNTDGSTTTGNGVSTVSWTPQAGKVTTLSATAQYTIGLTRTASFWALVLGGGGVLVAVLVAGLALLARRWQLRNEARDPAAYS
jgi:hypothetical protein